ncbi:MAG TPA: mandelate racemase/muconate lactonizing enzyme family protein [Candidatus Saccharimonadales bacterium]|nr:mandelate racemase/muconate lactonizing enzyme family protein [Candidatus Saccharimonadales bacterium]
MKITDVKATLHKIPIEAPLLKEKIWTPIVFTTVETDQGVTGYGLTRAAQRHGAKEFINREAAPFLRGKNPLETERVWQQLYKQFNPRGQTGMWSSAVSAIDIALWDIKGKHYQEPVWRLLGGAQNPVPAYVTFGLRNYNVEQLAEVAKQFVAEGQDKLKMVVAVEPENPRTDAERVRAVREAVGEKIELMIDANYLFSFNRALELCKLVEPYHITWFEEPVYQNDAHLLADLRCHTSIPIAAGQNEGHRFRHRELIVNRAVDIVQPNVCSVGGYTEAVKVAAMAQAFNLPIANGGGWPHHNMHLHAAMSNGWRVEFHLDMWKVGEVIYKNPPAPERGWVTIPEKPGLGLEPRWEALKEYEET